MHFLIVQLILKSIKYVFSVMLLQIVLDVSSTILLYAQVAIKVCLSMGLFALHVLKVVQSVSVIVSVHLAQMVIYLLRAVQ